jgi:hypothetical protein
MTGVLPVIFVFGAEHRHRADWILVMSYVVRKATSGLVSRMTLSLIFRNDLYVPDSLKGPAGLAHIPQDHAHGRGRNQYSDSLCRRIRGW